MSPKPTRAADVPLARHDLAIRRMSVSILVMSGIAMIGAFLYFLLGRGRWGFGECAYMAIITISTVGFGELSHMSDVPGARVVTVGLIAGGLGVIAYVQANLTTLLIEGSVRQVWRRNRMRREIVRMQGHFVVAGAGSTGRYCPESMTSSRN